MATVGLAVFAWPAAPDPPPLMVSAETTSRFATVHVSGEVLHPGLVVLAVPSRVADAIAAAGGAAPDADLGAVNLAAPVGDGSRLVVPARAAPGVPAAGGEIRINTATAAELEGLPGVGPVLAAEIIAFRSANGPFAVVEDLLDVPGIGEAKLGAMRDGVIVP